jgi:thiamine kinase-like enzyme
MDVRERVCRLPIWRGHVDPVPLDGGITNVNFVVADAGRKVVVRVGSDIPVHGVMRFNERAASEAAWRAGLSPAVVHAEPGILVIEYIEGVTFTPDHVQRPENLERIVPMVARVHREMPQHLQGPALVFWVFHVLRDYTHTLVAANSPYRDQLSRLSGIAAELESQVGAVTLVYGHNDLLPANIIDDGDRLWLIDWDYAGFNSPLFDLANLASNNGLSAEQEHWMLRAYFGGAADAALFHAYSAMTCASLLRESLWSMVSEIHSTLAFDYARYTTDYLGRFERAFERHRALGSSVLIRR